MSKTTFLQELDTIWLPTRLVYRHFTFSVLNRSLKTNIFSKIKIFTKIYIYILTTNNIFFQKLPIFNFFFFWLVHCASARTKHNSSVGTLFFQRLAQPWVYTINNDTHNYGNDSRDERIVKAVHDNANNNIAFIIIISRLMLYRHRIVMHANISARNDDIFSPPSADCRRFSRRNPANDLPILKFFIFFLFYNRKNNETFLGFRKKKK